MRSSPAPGHSCAAATQPGTPRSRRALGLAIRDSRFPRREDSNYLLVDRPAAGTDIAVELRRLGLPIATVPDERLLVDSAGAEVGHRGIVMVHRGPVPPARTAGGRGRAPGPRAAPARPDPQPAVGLARGRRPAARGANRTGAAGHGSLLRVARGRPGRRRHRPLPWPAGRADRGRLDGARAPEPRPRHRRRRDRRRGGSRGGRGLRLPRRGRRGLAQGLVREARLRACRPLREAQSA